MAIFFIFCTFERALECTWSHVSMSVSYTHLRAHETLRYLVCRLLLEKKTTKMSVREPLQIETWDQVHSKALSKLQKMKKLAMTGGLSETLGDYPTPSIQTLWDINMGVNGKNFFLTLSLLTLHTHHIELMLRFHNHIYVISSPEV